MARAFLGTLVVMALAGPARAGADPAFATIELKAGESTIVKQGETRVLVSADPSIATAETVNTATGEIRISGKAPGHTDIVALSGGRLVGIRVVVRGEGKLATPYVGDPDALLVTAKKACPSLSVTGEGKDEHLEVTAPSLPCRKALEPLLASGRWTMPQTRINFDTDTLTAQLGLLTAALKAAGVEGLALHYQGVSLVLAGHLTAAQTDRAILTLYHVSLGGVPLNDDELEIEGEADAGSF